MKGKISNTAHISGLVGGILGNAGSGSTGSGSTGGNTGETAPEYETFEGAYEVTPEMGREIVLETENKVMSRNVRIGEIPIHRVRGHRGSITIVIGGITGGDDNYEQ